MKTVFQNIKLKADEIEQLLKNLLLNYSTIIHGEQFMF